jgi:integrase
MGRETSPHVIGQFWLDKRRDGKAAGVWQIAWYDDTGHTIRYRSTRCRELARAIDAIDAHYHADKAGKPQDASALVVPQLVLYWREHGQHAVKPAQIASSLRQFIAFLFQDKAGPGVTFAELRPEVFARFQRWRMAPHSYSIDWQGKTYAHASKGVNGESVQRNLDDIRAALNHAAGEGRVPYAPKVKGVRRELRSDPRDRVLAVAELASMIGYALSDPPLLRYIIAMIATVARPEVVRLWDVQAQADLQRGLFDTNPPGRMRTKKHNPVVPIPLFWRDWLGEWIADGKPLPATLRTRWRTMRRALGLGADVHAKTIRHTVATYLRGAGVPALDISGQLGHVMGNRATGVYAKYDPDYLAKARTSIDALWIEVMFAVRSWATDHIRTISPKGVVLVIDSGDRKAFISPCVGDGGR